MTLMSIEGEQYGTWRWFPISGPASMIRYYPVGLREGYVFGVAGNVHLLPSGPADTVPMLRPDDVPSTMLRCPGPDGSIRFFSAPFARDWVGAPAPGAGSLDWEDVDVPARPVEAALSARANTMLPLYRSFITSIETGAPLPCSGANARQALEMITAVHESHLTGARAHLPLTQRRNPYRARLERGAAPALD